MLSHQIKPALVSLQDNAVYRFADLKAAGWIPFCRSHVYDLMKTGDFPKQIKVGKFAAGWTGKAIKDYHQACINNAA